MSLDFPVFAENAAEESTVLKAARYFKAAAPLAKELAKDMATEDNSNGTVPHEGEQEKGKGFWEETMESVFTIGDKGQNIIPRIMSLKETWAEVKEVCTAIKETAEDTLSLLWWIAVGIAIFTSSVPVFLVAILLYLHNVNKKLNALSKQE